MSKKNKNKKSNQRWAQKHSNNQEAKVSRLIDTSFELPALRHESTVSAVMRGESPVVSDAILKVLRFYSERTLRNLNEEGLRRLNQYVQTVFTVLTMEKFRIPREQIMVFAANCHIFANVVSMSLFETTDAVLQIVLAQENNLPKVCFLYTVRNKLQLPIKKFFDINPPLASRWYISATAPSGSPSSELLLNNMRRFYAEADDRLIVFDDSCHVSYFASSYIDGDLDAVLKPKINAACQRQTEELQITNTPKENKIAVVTSKWFPNSAVCKSAKPLIEKLFGKYHVTLVHTGYIPKELNTEGFDEVIYLEKTGLEPILNNDFKMIYYCDIGMTPESVMLSNLRLAPIQVMSYGHPASTFGSKVDYFLGGEEVECVNRVQEKYTERMVLIPGMGCLAAYPNYKREYPTKEHDEVIIQCVWGPDKYFYPSLLAMKRALDRFEKPAKFHFYPSVSINRNNTTLPFLRDIKTIFGDDVVVWTQYEYFDYMKSVEHNSDMALNSPPPFGGFNTVVEAMYLDIPVLHCQGDTFRTMVGGVLNERVGLPEWNTNNLQEWEDRLVEIVNTGEWRAAKKHLEDLDLKKAVFSGEEPEYFEKAIKYLMENGDKEDVKKEREPLIVRNL